MSWLPSGTFQWSCGGIVVCALLCTSPFSNSFYFWPVLCGQAFWPYLVLRLASDRFLTWRLISPWLLNIPLFLATYRLVKWFSISSLCLNNISRDSLCGVLIISTYEEKKTLNKRVLIRVREWDGEVAMIVSLLTLGVYGESKFPILVALITLSQSSVKSNSDVVVHIMNGLNCWSAWVTWWNFHIWVLTEDSFMWPAGTKMKLYAFVKSEHDQCWLQNCHSYHLTLTTMKWTDVFYEWKPKIWWASIHHVKPSWEWAFHTPIVSYS